MIFRKYLVQKKLYTSVILHTSTATGVLTLSPRFKKPDASDTLAAVAMSHGLEDRAAVGAAKAEEGKLADEDECTAVHSEKGGVVRGRQAGQPYRARSRLYRRRMSQLKPRLKAASEIYTMHIF